MTFKLTKHERLTWSKRWRFTLQDADQVCKRHRLRAADALADHLAAVKLAQTATPPMSTSARRAVDGSDLGELAAKLQPPEPYNRARVLTSIARVRYAAPADAPEVGPAAGRTFLVRAQRHAASVGPNVERTTAANFRLRHLRRAHRASGSMLSLKAWARSIAADDAQPTMGIFAPAMIKLGHKLAAQARVRQPPPVKAAPAVKPAKGSK